MLKVAAVQMASRLGDSAGNLRLAVECARDAAHQGTRFIAFPEFFHCGSITETANADVFDLAESLEGPTIQTLAALARELDVWLCVPLFELSREKEESRYFNCAVILDAAGNVAARYRKRFLPNRRANEKRLFSPGDLPSPVWEIDGVRFGVNICFERQFIETSRIPALKGADVLVHPSHTWGSPGAMERWHAQATTMARLNSLWVLAACATHRPGEVGPGGGSLIADPSGEIVRSMGGEIGVLVVELDPAVARSERERARLLCEQREDVLRELIAAGQLAIGASG